MSLIPKSTLYKYVMDISKSYRKQSIRFMKQAKISLHDSVEEHIKQICEIACKVTKHCNRKIILVRDVKLALDIIACTDNKNIKRGKAELKLTHTRLVAMVKCPMAKDIHVPLIEAASIYIHNILKTLYTVYPDVKLVTKHKLKEAQQIKRVEKEPIDRFWHALEKGDDVDSDDEPILDGANQLRDVHKRIIAKKKAKKT